MKLFAAPVFILLLANFSHAEQQQDFGNYVPSQPTHIPSPAETHLTTGIAGLTEAKFLSLISGYVATGRYCRAESLAPGDGVSDQSIFEVEVTCKTDYGRIYSDNCGSNDYSWVVRYKIPATATVTADNYINFIDKERTRPTPVATSRSCGSSYGGGRGTYGPNHPPPPALYLGNGVYLFR